VETKANRHVPAKVNGWTMSHEDIKESTVKMVLKRKFGKKIFAIGGSVEVFMIARKVYKRLRDCMWTFLAASLEELITRTPRQAQENPGAESEHFQDNCEERQCQRMSEHSQARKRTEDWLKKRCRRRRSGLPANLFTAFWTILCGASLSYR
jgi:hypothetical protein